MSSEPVAFTIEHMEELGIWTGGVYESLAVIPTPDGAVARPLGVHVPGGAAVHVDLYLPSSTDPLLIEGSRFILAFPAYRDLEALARSAMAASEDIAFSTIDHEGERFDTLKGMPGLLVEVSGATEQTLADRYGNVKVRRLLLDPVATLLPPHPWSPICRAHGHVLEASILLTKPSQEGAREHVRDARKTAPDRYSDLLDSMENVI